MRIEFKFDVRFFCLFVLMFLVEATIAIFVHVPLIRHFMGDVLVVVLLYFFARSFLTLGKGQAVALVVSFAWCIEFGQYFGLVHLLGLQEVRLARIIIGTTFDKMDLLAYSIGGIALIASGMLRPKQTKTVEPEGH